MPEDSLNDLPNRLRPVLRELLQGKSNAEIAKALTLQIHTVESYVSKLLSFSGCRNRTELAVRVLQGELGNLKDFEEVFG